MHFVFVAILANCRTGKLANGNGERERRASETLRTREMYVWRLLPCWGSHKYALRRVCRDSTRHTQQGRKRGFEFSVMLGWHCMIRIFHGMKIFCVWV